jgi:hypothetical protein
VIKRMTLTQVSYDGGQTWIAQPRRLEWVRETRARPEPIGLTSYPLLLWPLLVPFILVGWTLGFLLGCLIRVVTWGLGRRRVPVRIQRVILEEEQR